MTILCDVDSVVANIMPEWLRMYNEECGDALRPPDIVEWDMHKLVKPECGRKLGKANI